MDEPIPPHGTRARYNSRVARCRCELCRKANTGYMRMWRSQEWRQLRLPGCP
jgi:hypothetical protein